MAATGLPPQVPVPQPIPVVLSFVAGYVDSCIFLALFGLYVAQLTGSFVLAGTQVVTHDDTAVIRVIAIPVFILAAMLTTIVATLAHRSGRFPLLYALALEAVLLIGMLVAALVDPAPHDLNAPSAILAAVLGVGAMGVQSAFVRLLMRGVASTNVMTTNTTVVAIDVTEILITWFDRRTAHEDAAAHRQFEAAVARFRALWPLGVGFFAGTLTGALAFAGVGLSALSLAVAIVLALVGWAWRQ